MHIERNARELLRALGIGNFNATMMIRNMFMAPATTDPKSPQIMLIVAALQDKLNALGAGIVRTGYLDGPTATALDQIVGPGWERRTWSDVIAAVVGARNGDAFAQADANRAPVPADRTSMSGMSGMPLGLPDVPGGIVTYGVAAFLIYKAVKKRKR